MERSTGYARIKKRVQTHGKAKIVSREVFCEKLAEGSSHSNTTNFWRMVRNGIRPTFTTMIGPCKIGEANSDENVLRLWKRHFGAIINSGYSEDLERERVIFQDLLETSERNSKWPWWSVEIRPSEVETAIRHLKMNKSAGPDGIESEHLRFGGYELSIHECSIYRVHETCFRAKSVFGFLYCAN